jgi:hypothetical protein
VSIIEPPYDDELFDLSTDGGTAYARGAIIEAGVREGYSIGSVRQALAGYGVGFSSSQVSETYNALSGIISAGQTAAALPVDVTTGEIFAGPPPENWTGQYVYQVTATFRAQTESGGYELRTRTMGVKSTEVLSANDAVNAAMSLVNAPVEEEDEDTYGGMGNLLTMSMTGAWPDTRPGVLAARAS